MIIQNRYLIDERGGTHTVKRRMVHAFKRRLARETQIIEAEEPLRKDKVSMFMNTMRQRIYLYVCRYPCTCLSAISYAIGSTSTTARWHLKRLIEFEFVGSAKVAGKEIYFPRNLISKPDLELLTVINSNDKVRPILNKIFAQPGISQRELAIAIDLNPRTIINHTTQLEKFGVIRSVRDGKWKRYYPTDKISTKARQYRTRIKQFKSDLLLKLKRDGVNPRIILSQPDMLRLKLATGEKSTVIELMLNPFRF
jgi:DNA-binding transcriptional ArsR family regulator